MAKSKPLRYTGVWRRGETETDYRQEPGAAPTLKSDKAEQTIELECSLPSKGGGTVVVNVTVGRRDFVHLFKAMVAAGG